MLWGGESSGEKSRLHPSSFTLGFESLFAALGLSVADGGEGMRRSWRSFGRLLGLIWLTPFMSSTQLRKSYSVLRRRKALLRHHPTQ